MTDEAFTRNLTLKRRPKNPRYRLERETTAYERKNGASTMEASGPYTFSEARDTAEALKSRGLSVEVTEIPVRASERARAHTRNAPRRVHNYNDPAELAEWSNVEGFWPISPTLSRTALKRRQEGL